MRRGSVSMVGVAPGGASSFFKEALRSSTPSLPCLLISLSPALLRRKLVPDVRRVWHKKDAMARFRSLGSPAPLDRERLEEMALRYVGRFATTKAKLTAYLWRKVRERGWNEEEKPDL